MGEGFDTVNSGAVLLVLVCGSRFGSEICSVQGREMKTTWNECHFKYFSYVPLYYLIVFKNII